jgi:hypothetical protein
MHVDLTQTRVFLAVVVAGAISLQPWFARADEGDGEGIGPVIGYSGERSWSFGWEASVARGRLPLIKGTVGGVYHVAPKASDPYTLHYAAVEPWFIAGGTLGLAVADGREVLRLVYGAWEGFPVSLTKDVDPFGGRSRTAWMFTFTIGVRAFGSTSQVYFTPKLWRFTTIAFNS